MEIAAFEKGELWVESPTSHKVWLLSGVHLENANCVQNLAKDNYLWSSDTSWFDVMQLSISLSDSSLLKKNGQIMDNEQFLYLGWTKVMWLWANFQLQWPTTNPKHLENFKQTGINCHNKLCNNQIILNVFDEWFIVTLHDFSSVCLVIWL